MNAAPELVDLLAARRGIVCAVGAGGKKSVLRAIAAAHPGRVGLTGTVPFVPPPDTLPGSRWCAEPDEIAERLAVAAEHRIAVFGRPAEKKGRWGGLPPDLIADWYSRFGFDAILVKADGARMRWIKAPTADEPALPARCDTLIPVLSARALGEPLSERIAHRPQLVERVTGCRIGQIFSPEHAATLLSSADGLLKDAGSSEARPVINMVDDPERQALAEEAAGIALRMTGRFDQVLLMQLKDPARLVAVIRRQAGLP